MDFNMWPHWRLDIEAILPASPTKKLNKIDATSVFRNWKTQSTELLKLKETSMMIPFEDNF